MWVRWVRALRRTPRAVSPCMGAHSLAPAGLTAPRQPSMRASPAGQPVAEGTEPASPQRGWRDVLRGSGNLQDTQLMQQLRSVLGGSPSPSPSPTSALREPPAWQQPQPQGIPPPPGQLAPASAATGQAAGAGRKPAPLLLPEAAASSPGASLAGARSPGPGEDLQIREFLGCFSPAAAGRVGPGQPSVAGSPPPKQQPAAGGMQPDRPLTSGLLRRGEAGSLHEPAELAARAASLPNLDAFLASRSGSSSSRQRAQQPPQQHILADRAASPLTAGRQRAAAAASAGARAPPSPAGATGPAAEHSVQRSAASQPAAGSWLLLSSAPRLQTTPQLTPPKSGKGYSPSRLSTRSMPLSSAADQQAPDGEEAASQEQAVAQPQVGVRVAPSTQHPESHACTKPTHPPCPNFRMLPCQHTATQPIDHFNPLQEGSGESSPSASGVEEEPVVHAPTPPSPQQPQQQPAAAAVKVSPVASAKRPLLARALFNRLRLHSGERSSKGGAEPQAAAQEFSPLQRGQQQKPGAAGGNASTDGGGRADGAGSAGGADTSPPVSPKLEKTSSECDAACACAMLAAAHL